MNSKNCPEQNAWNIENQKQYVSRVQSMNNELSLRLARPLQIYIATFGCQQNEADSERLLGTAIMLGYKKTDNIEKADLIIFNTCAVREHAELRALSKTGQLKHLKSGNKALVVGLWGCMVSQKSRVEEIRKKYPYVDFVAGTNMLHRFPEILCDVMETRRRRFYVDDKEFGVVEGVPVCRQNNTNVWISIMYGCDNFCSYCIVPYVRGRERSRAKIDILSEVRDVLDKGAKEITLLGQNVNSYGKGLCGSDKCDFAELVDEICKIDGDFVVRFMTSHPKDVSDKLVEVIARNPKVERHFHLPLRVAGLDLSLRQERQASLVRGLCGRNARHRDTCRGHGAEGASQ